MSAHHGQHGKGYSATRKAQKRAEAEARQSEESQWTRAREQEHAERERRLERRNAAIDELLGRIFGARS